MRNGTFLNKVINYIPAREIKNLFIQFKNKLVVARYGSPKMCSKSSNVHKVFDSKQDCEM